MNVKVSTSVFKSNLVLLNSCTIGTLSHISSSTGVPDGILTPIEESNSTPDSSVLNYRPSGGDENNTFQQWKQKVVCTAIVVSEKDGFCARVNTLGSYLDINLKFAKYVNVLKLKDDVEAKEKAQLLQQTLLQQSTQKSTNQAKKKKEKESPDTPKPDASKPPTHSKASSQSKIPSQPSAASIESPSMLQKNKSAAEVTGSLSKLKLSSAQDITQVNLTTPIPKVQIGADSLLGDGCKIGDRCSIKRSVIGSNCIIGKNVKVADSVIMDYVTIEDSAKIEGCILSRSVKIQEKSLLKECEVGGGQIVPHDTIGKNEQYSLEN